MRKKLSELDVGEEGIIVDILRGPANLLRRLLDMGLVRNTRVKVVRRAPLGDPIEFEVSGYPLSLRREEAEYVIVEVE